MKTVSIFTILLGIVVEFLKPKTYLPIYFKLSVLVDVYYLLFAKFLL